MHLPLQELRDLVRRLLVHNPAQRLGVMKGNAADVKAHAWFAGFDWDSFARKTAKAPYVPKACSKIGFTFAPVLYMPTS